jgi:hypothetical protein
MPGSRELVAFFVKLHSTVGLQGESGLGEWGMQEMIDRYAHGSRA